METVPNDWIEANVIPIFEGENRNVGGSIQL